MSTKRIDSPYNLCTFTFADGRMCGMPAHPEYQFLCLHHAKIKERHMQAPREDSLLRDFARARCGGYMTQLGLHHVLSSICEALADNRISTKRATSLAYICNLLMVSQQRAMEEAADWESVVEDHNDILEIKYPDRFGEDGDEEAEPEIGAEAENEDQPAAVSETDTQPATAN